MADKGWGFLVVCTGNHDLMIYSDSSKIVSWCIERNKEDNCQIIQLLATPQVKISLPIHLTARCWPHSPRWGVTWVEYRFWADIQDWDDQTRITLSLSCYRLSGQRKLIWSLNQANQPTNCFTTSFLFRQWGTCRQSSDAKKIMTTSPQCSRLHVSQPYFLFVG